MYNIIIPITFQPLYFFQLMDKTPTSPNTSGKKGRSHQFQRNRHNLPFLYIYHIILSAAYHDCLVRIQGFLAGFAVVIAEDLALCDVCLPGFIRHIDPDLDLFTVFCDTLKGDHRSHGPRRRSGIHGLPRLCGSESDFCSNAGGNLCPVPASWHKWLRSRHCISAMAYRK